LLIKRILEHQIFPNGATITGVATATSIKVGTAVTISSGVVEATSFVGSASSMTGITGKAAAMSIVFWMINTTKEV